MAIKLPHTPALRLVLFVLVFGAVGGAFLLLRTEAAVPYAPNPPHAARCVENSPSKTVVRPGEAFTARVRIFNSGTSTYTGSVGMALHEFPNGGNVWNAGGKNLSGNVGPGGTATFNLTVRAPSQPGTYTFDWGLAIAYVGYLRTPCTGSAGGRTIVVTNPPTISLTTNGQTGTLNLVRGSGLTLGWSVGNNPSSCVASGSWSGGKPASGSESRTSDTASAGTKSYTLSCSNGAGSGSATRTVIVSNPPSSPTPSTPRPSTPTSPSSPRPSNPSSPNTSAPSTPVSNPSPTVPSGFSATVEDEVAVRLRWDKPNYGGMLKGYELDRSVDKQNWQALGSETVEGETFTDSTTQFQTTYYYRVRAVDQSGEKSEYATAEVTTPPFSANTSTEGSTFNSEDGLVSVFIPGDAIDEDASCSLQGYYDVLPPVQDKFTTIAGPLEILCKTASGNKITQFNKPLQVTVSAPNTNYSTFAYYGLDEQLEWQSIEGYSENDKGSFSLENTTVFSVLGQKKSMPIFFKIMIALAVIGGVAFGGLLAINFYGRYRQIQAVKRRNEDYHRQELGL